MANSTFPIPIGKKNGANRDALDAIRTERFPFIHAPIYVYEQIVQFSDYSDSDTSEALDLNATFTGNAFPANVLVWGAWLDHITDWAGGSVSAATLELGDVAATQELVAATSVFTGVGASLLAGVAGYGPKLEAAYVPLLELNTTTDNIDSLTAGKTRVCILHTPIAALPTS